MGRGEGFTEMRAARTRVDFNNTLPDSLWLRNRHLVNGSGVALGDVDGDGWSDIFLASMAGLNALYINHGNWTFGEVSDHATTEAEARTSGAVMADMDGDDDLDLILTSLGGGITAFENEGKRSFIDITHQAGLWRPGGATSMALADVDGDNDLDLYVGYYKAQTVKDLYPPERLAFERVVRAVGDTYAIDPEFASHYRLVRQGNRLMRLEVAEPDHFFLNDGEGRFEEVNPLGGAFRGEDGQPLRETPRDWALSVRFQDLSGDRIPDLYVCNDFESPDRFWIGDGKGGFDAAPATAVRKTSQSTMSVAAGDANGDGHVDLFLADMLSMHYVQRQRQHLAIPPEVVTIGDLAARPQVMQNMLLVADGDGTFAEVAYMAGVAQTGWTWSSAFLDVNLDGHQDLLLTTGHVYDAMDSDAQMQSGRPGGDWRTKLRLFPGLDLPNVAFRGRGDGTFVLMPDGWGLGWSPDVSHGMAFADLDGDGDLDAVINRLNGPAGLFRNNATAPRLAVRLRGTAPNTRAVGARIVVTGDGLPTRQAEVIAGGLYLSSSDPLRSFAVRERATVTVHWPSGQESVIWDAEAGYLYELREGEAWPVAPPDSIITPRALMRPVTLPLVHYEAPYQDFARQPLLPRRLSQRGPALAITDADGDGEDDIVMGAGRGGRLAFVKNPGGATVRIEHLGPPASGDHAGVVAAGDGRLVVAVSNYERGPVDAEEAAMLQVMTLDAPDGTQTITLGAATPGPLVLADFDADGSLDLLVGGHFVPGRYPESASSQILRGYSDTFVADPALSQPLKDVGLVSGAVAGDLDGDGDSDLALAVEWGPVKVFLNDGRGLLTDRTEALGLGAYIGWWNGVALGDFDGDGRLDMVATNWGTNTSYAGSGRPLVAYYGDLDRNGTVDILEARFDAGLSEYGMVRDLRVLSHAIPPIVGRVRSYHEFAELNVTELFGEVLGAMDRHEAHTLTSMVFLNRGDTFEGSPLPLAAQRTPAFAAAVADYDGDGNEDLFLSQNFFAVPETQPRMDAGRGLMLLGDGHGSFEPMSAAAAGIAVFGEQRAAAVGDFDRDGRADLVVTQNGSPPVLHMNQGERPGILVTLKDPFGGIGAVMRLRYADGTAGPARIVAAGSGYWTQHALEQVLGAAGTPVALWVRWPGGVVTESPLAPDQSAVVSFGPNDR